MTTMKCEMETYKKRKGVSIFRSIFLLVMLVVLIVLLCSTKTFKLGSKIHSAPQLLPIRGSPLLHHNHSYCSYWGPELSFEEALEQRSLLDSIKWPEPPLFSTLPPLQQTSDPAHSWFTILPAEGGRERHVGDQLDVLIQMNDFQGHPKRYGGDVLFARLHNPNLVAGMVGQVVDHLNGSYSCVFPLLWEGSAHVEVTLLHPSEAVTVLLRTKRQQPDRLFYKSQFRSGSISQTTVCNICLISNQQPLCNYTDLNTGEPYYCYKPMNLSCDKRFDNNAGGLKKTIATKEEALLFKSGVNLKVHIRASGSDTVNGILKKKDEPEVTPRTLKAMPSGYYYQGVWQALGGVPVRQFINSSAVIQCLKNKQVHMYGDSTARQWFEYLSTTLPELKEILHSPVKLGPYEAVNITNNIMLTFRCHGPPITFNVPTSVLRYIANELDRLVGGRNTVVVLSIWAHFTPFPMEVYINRLRNIRSSVIRLLDRAPGTLVVFRMGNPRVQHYDHTLSYSDWYAQQQNKVLRAMFKGLNVCMVDAWEMSLAHHLPHDIHPGLPIIKNMINVLLSYIC